MSKTPEQFNPPEKAKKTKKEKVTEQVEVESKEKNKKPFLLTYRENDLFKKYASNVVTFLREQGYQVNTQVFPAGTPEEEIKKWYLAHQKEIESSNVISDYTVLRSSGYKIEDRINLDGVFFSTTQEAIMGDIQDNYSKLHEELCKNPGNKERKQEYLKLLGEMYKKILWAIPEERRKKLEFYILTGISKYIPNFPKLIEHEPFINDSKNNKLSFKELSKETSEFATKMKEWFNESGVANVTIINTGVEIPYETLTKLLNNEANVIFDRHTYTSEKGYTKEGMEEMEEFWGASADKSREIQEISALRTPIETFYGDAQKKIGLKEDPERMLELLKKNLQKQLKWTENK